LPPFVSPDGGRRLNDSYQLINHAPERLLPHGIDSLTKLAGADSLTQITAFDDLRLGENTAFAGSTVS